jgi:multiple sugar transport system permease protein
MTRSSLLRARRWGWSLPGLVALGALVILPALATLPLALLHFDGVTAPRFAGGENLARLWNDPLFWKSLSNSLKVLLVAVPLRLALALALALLLHRAGPGVGLGRAAALAPGVTPDIAWALIWLFLLNPLYGPVAMALPLLGIAPDAWLTQPTLARNLLALMTLWLIGELVVVLIAARQELGREVYEAARIEGASAWHIFRRITLPLLMPVLVLLACRDAALSFQTSLTPAMIVTKGGPQFGTLLLPLYAYQNGFEYLRFGYAAAIQLALFAITLLLIAVQLRWLKRWTAAAR